MRNQDRLNANRAAGGTPASRAREGTALLPGLVVCARCKYRMVVQYSRSRNGTTYARYVCSHNKVTYGVESCGALSALRLDEVVSKLALTALAPAALDVSLRVSRELERERARIDALWEKRLQRARYEAERAERQYHAVDPENRLVARTLERAWEEKLEAERTLQEQHRRQQEQQPRRLTPAEQVTIRKLAHDLPRLWSAGTTKTSDRKSVLRILIDRVTISIDESSEWVELTVGWVGGHETRSRFRRPVGKLEQLEGHDGLMARIHELRRDGFTASRIAEKLNAEGWVTPTQRNGFTDRLIHMMLERHGFVPRGPRASPSDDPSEWWLADLAKKLDMPVVTMYGWHSRGLLKTKRVNGLWVAIADKAELRRLRRMRKQNLS